MPARPAGRGLRPVCSSSDCSSGCCRPSRRSRAASKCIARPSSVIGGSRSRAADAPDVPAARSASTTAAPFSSQQVADASDPPTPSAGDPVRFLKPPDADDERADWTGEEIEAEEQEQIEAITLVAEADGPADADAALWAREQRLLDRMQAIAEETRHLPDAKTRRLIDWIREHQCPELPPFGQRPTLGAPPSWNARRVLVFTENMRHWRRRLAQFESVPRRKPATAWPRQHHRKGRAGRWAERSGASPVPHGRPSRASTGEPTSEGRGAGD